MEQINALVAKWTGAKTLDELSETSAGSNYLPSLRCKSGFPGCRRQSRAELKLIADAYDSRQQRLGDPRRAYRC